MRTKSRLKRRLSFGTLEAKRHANLICIRSAMLELDCHPKFWVGAIPSFPASIRLRPATIRELSNGWPRTANNWCFLLLLPLAHLLISCYRLMLTHWQGHQDFISTKHQTRSTQNLRTRCDPIATTRQNQRARSTFEIVLKLVCFGVQNKFQIRHELSLQRHGLEIRIVDG